MDHAATPQRLYVPSVIISSRYTQGAVRAEGAVYLVIRAACGSDLVTILDFHVDAVADTLSTPDASTYEHRPGP